VSEKSKKKNTLVRSICAVIVAALAVLASPAASIAAESPCPSILDHKFANLTNEPVALCQFRGKVLLIVNTASECGYTPQYEGLEKLYRRYRDKGFAVLGFPANDFGGQEPGSNQEIAQFCRLNYGVTFLMFAKTSVVGANANPFFRESPRGPGSRRAGTFISIFWTRRHSRSRRSRAPSSPLTRGLLRRSRNCSLRADTTTVQVAPAVERNHGLKGALSTSHHKFLDPSVQTHTLIVLLRI
jgi:glutathione peroxidase